MREKLRSYVCVEGALGERQRPIPLDDANGIIEETHVIVKKEALTAEQEKVKALESALAPFAKIAKSLGDFEGGLVGILKIEEGTKALTVKYLGPEGGTLWFYIKDEDFINASEALQQDKGE